MASERLARNPVMQATQPRRRSKSNAGRAPRDGQVRQRQEASSRLLAAFHSTYRKKLPEAMSVTREMQALHRQNYQYFLGSSVVFLSARHPEALLPTLTSSCATLDYFVNAEGYKAYRAYQTYLPPLDSMGLLPPQWVREEEEFKRKGLEHMQNQEAAKLAMQQPPPPSILATQHQPTHESNYLPLVVINSPPKTIPPAPHYLPSSTLKPVRRSGRITNVMSARRASIIRANVESGSNLVQDTNVPKEATKPIGEKVGDVIYVATGEPHEAKAIKVEDDDDSEVMIFQNTKTVKGTLSVPPRPVLGSRVTKPRNPFLLPKPPRGSKVLKAPNVLTPDMALDYHKQRLREFPCDEVDCNVVSRGAKSSRRRKPGVGALFICHIGECGREKKRTQRTSTTPLVTSLKEVFKNHIKVQHGRYMTSEQLDHFLVYPRGENKENEVAIQPTPINWAGTGSTAFSVFNPGPEQLACLQEVLSQI
ncbi:hypothetical protein B0T10DRAFT_589420 [Thelonectria olida]|uniref:Uncharacterized protein n=1 Tax=Thelonectria olida TaxID=1576542 RepID=A0A9P8WAQ2_9HYPO|nr:hypothetical protein B0T10DRAFT_589420 [Thelonectria olida]